MDTSSIHTKNLDHHGLVAGFCQEIGISKLLDEALPEQPKDKKLSYGQLLEAMILNGLGFTGRTLHMYSQYFEDKPLERLLGEGICAEDINDDALGRCLDKLFEHGVSDLYQMLGEAVVKHLGLACSLNKREQNDVSSFITQAPALLTDVYEHCYDNTKCRANVYSFNRKEVSLFNKNKHHKGVEYGRQFQIARIEGNFLFSIPNDSLRMPDAESFKKMLKGHIETFQTPIESITTDKGYYSKANEQLALDFGIKKVGVQRPNRYLKNPPDNPTTDEEQEELYNRRSGIEPLIGHLKNHGQMGRSRAKTDRTTHSSGFTSILGFNLRQMMRYLTGVAQPVAAGG